MISVLNWKKLPLPRNCEEDKEVSGISPNYDSKPHTFSDEAKDICIYRAPVLHSFSLPLSSVFFFFMRKTQRCMVGVNSTFGDSFNVESLSSFCPALAYTPSGLPNAPGSGPYGENFILPYTAHTSSAIKVK